MKLKQKQIKERAALSAKVGIARTELETELDAFNAAVRIFWEDRLLPKIDAYNQALTDAREWIEERHGEIDEFIASKSERWQAGNRGILARAMSDAYSQVDLEDVELTMPELNLDDVENHEDMIDQLPDEPA